MSRRNILGILFLILIGLGGPQSALRPVTELAEKTRTGSADVFTWFKNLPGQWLGKSTKGWEETMSVRTIAGGSVVLFSSFDAHPGQEMLTAFHLDGQELVLTHYCIAKNQPRLLATEVDPQARTVIFTFKDGTNLPSRDSGHMDKVVYRFQDENNFSSRWTWYQDGEEQWMEEIVYQRVDDMEATR